MKTENEAYLSLAALCAQAEHCQWELLQKMRRWGLPDDAQARVAERLLQEHYVDDERYARAFVHDKVHFAKWGRRKIEQALWQKGIADDIRQRTLSEVDNSEYLAVLRPLLKQKRKSVKAQSDYELNQKLMRFAMSRGYTFDVIKQCIDVDNEPDDDDTPFME